MKELKLIDRVVVEIRNDENASQCQSRFVAEQLRKIADLIEDGYTGRTWMADEHTDVSWERKKRSTGFKIVSNKSLISQYYYHRNLHRVSSAKRMNKRNLTTLV